MTNNTTAGIDLDNEIEELAMKHIAVGWAQAVTVNGHNPDYRKTAQFHRLKAFDVDLLAHCSTSGSELAPALGPQRWSKEVEMMESWIAQAALTEQAAGAVCQPLADERAMFEMAAKFGRKDKFNFRIPGTSDSHKVECVVMEQSDVAAFVKAIAHPIGQQSPSIDQQGGAPAGYKLVPIEPTPQMIAANGHCEWPEGAQMLADDARSTWKAMLAAAPAPSAQDERDAARYRFLRHADLDELARTFWPDADVPEGDELDAAIDAAMSQAKGAGKEGAA